MAKKQLKKDKERQEIEYLEFAAKMVEYPVDIYYKTIDVPESELETIPSNLAVMHLVKQFNFKIQSCIEVIKKEVFNPVCTSTKIQTAKEQIFKVGERFSLISGFRQIEITEIKNSKLYFKYIGNVVRADGDMKIEDLERAIKNQKAQRTN